MEKIIERVSTYNIFNNLFPGVVFSIFCDKFTNLPLLQNSIVEGIFWYYFIGLVINRVGSIIVQPGLKIFGLLEEAPYVDFISASQIDEKNDLLSEVNNMYRTIVSMILMFLIAVIGSEIIDDITGYLNYVLFGCIAFLFLLFLYSYKKQTSYIVKRVKLNKNE